MKHQKRKTDRTLSEWDLNIGPYHQVKTLVPRPVLSRLVLTESSLTHSYSMRRVLISLYDHSIHLFSPKMDDSYVPGYLDGDELLKVKESCKSKSAAERDSLNKYYREENERRKKKQLSIIPLNVGRGKRKPDDLDGGSIESGGSAILKRGRQKTHEEWEGRFIFTFTQFQINEFHPTPLTKKNAQREDLIKLI